MEKKSPLSPHSTQVCTLIMSILEGHILLRKCVIKPPVTSISFPKKRACSLQSFQPVYVAMAGNSRILGPRYVASQEYAGNVWSYPAGPNDVLIHTHTHTQNPVFQLHQHLPYIGQSRSSWMVSPNKSL